MHVSRALLETHMKRKADCDGAREKASTYSPLHGWISFFLSSLLARGIVHMSGKNSLQMSGGFMKKLSCSYSSRMFLKFDKGLRIIAKIQVSIRLSKTAPRKRKVKFYLKYVHA